MGQAPNMNISHRLLFLFVFFRLSLLNTGPDWRVKAFVAVRVSSLVGVMQVSIIRLSDTD